MTAAATDRAGVVRGLPELDAVPAGSSAAGVVSALVRRRLRETPPNKQVLAGEVSVTYGQIAVLIDRLAAVFASRGIGVGSRVLLVTDDEARFVEAFLALFACGMTTVPLNPEAPLVELVPLARTADPAAIVATGAIAEALMGAGCAPNLRLVVATDGDPSPATTPDGSLVAAFPKATANDAMGSDRAFAIPLESTAIILFTSGTTSRPKGVELTYGNLLHHLRTLLSVYGFDARTRVLDPVPLHHTDGCFHGALLQFACGGTLVRPGSFAPASLLESLDRAGRSGITHAILTPTFIYYLTMVPDQAREVLGSASFEYLISTGAFLNEPLWREAENTFGKRIVNVYGLTETVTESLYCGPSDATRRIGTIGKPVDCEARVVGDDGSPVPPGTPGELCLKGPHVMKGYFRNPEETVKVLRDGWLLTGDIATVDEDGFYRIVGRKKNVIITGGINVYPEDVTNVVRAMPGVADAVTFGLPDEVFGERVVCCIQPEAGASLGPNDVRRHCRQSMATYKIPRDVHFIDALPRGPVGKIQIEEVKRMLQAMAEETSEQAG
jgi:long-chain acyl-CoA synthetase